jgi:hypothetical protein
VRVNGSAYACRRVIVCVCVHACGCIRGCCCGGGGGGSVLRCITLSTITLSLLIEKHVLVDISGSPAIRLLGPPTRAKTSEITPGSEGSAVRLGAPLAVALLLPHCRSEGDSLGPALRGCKHVENVGRIIVRVHEQSHRGSHLLCSISLVQTVHDKCVPVHVFGDQQQCIAVRCWCSSRVYRTTNIEHRKEMQRKKQCGTACAPAAATQPHAPRPPRRPQQPLCLRLE